MQLNKDCIRDILIYIENHTIYEEIKGFKTKQLHTITFDELCKEDNIKYSNEEINYTLQKMKDYDLIKFPDEYRCQSNFAEYLTNFKIEKITQKGHEFIDNAKNDVIWNKAKEDIKQAGLEDCSFNILFEYIYQETRKTLNL